MPITIEVSAVKFPAIKGPESEGVETCNDKPGDATCISVYVNNNKTSWLHDFDDKSKSMLRNYISALGYAENIAETMGCDVVSKISMIPSTWSKR